MDLDLKLISSNRNM